MEIKLFDDFLDCGKDSKEEIRMNMTEEGFTEGIEWNFVEVEY